MLTRSGSTGRATIPWAVLACVLLLGATAHAAPVTIKGPAGASVTIDGQARGRLPLAAPVDLEAGIHVLRCEMRGHVAHVEKFDLTERDALTITVSLLPISRWRAAGYSLLLGGLGQHYQDRHRMGWILLAAQLTAAGVAVYGEGKFKDKRDAYEDVYAAYQQALDSRVIEARKAEALAAYDEVEKAQTFRNVALWTLAGTAVVSVVDAWLAHDHLFVQGGEPPAGTSSLDRPLQLGWRVRF